MTILEYMKKLNLAKRLLYPLVIAALVFVAAVGACQVIQGQQGETPEPIAVEDLRKTEEVADILAHQRMVDFVATGGDPCSLPVGELLAGAVAPYPDVPVLMNDSDTVVLGRLAVGTLDPPIGLGSTLVTLPATVQVEEVIFGSAPDASITVDIGAGISSGAGAIDRYAAIGLDPCAAGRVLLFLKASSREDRFATLYQGWALLDGDSVASAPMFGLFESYTSADQLLTYVRDIARSQEERPLPKGFLLCDLKRSSAPGEAAACPGESFNPFLAFRLDVLDSAFVVTTEPGPGARAVGRVDLAGDSAELASLAAGLNTVVLVEPAGPRPSDLVIVRLSRDEGITFHYSPSAGIIQMPAYGGQFPAPAAFEQAVTPLLSP